MESRVAKSTPLVSDPTNIVQVLQPLQHGQCGLPNDININGSNLLVDPAKQPLVHELHADADVGI